MTCQQEMDAKGRPMGCRATWELRNMVRALERLPFLNTSDDITRLKEAKRELKIREER